MSRKFLELEEPFGRIAEVDSYAGGEPVTILTILSKTSQNLDSGLLDRGGQQLDVMYEPGTPIADDGAEGEFAGAEVGGERDELQGRGARISKTWSCSHRRTEG